MDVSIVITTYNYAKFISNCISSCLGQTGHNLDFEVVVIDDGSSDGTQKIIKKFSDTRLSSRRIENSGIERASNLGFSIAQGRYVVRVDADDTLQPDYLKIMGDYLDTSNAFIYPNYNVIDAFGELIAEIKLPEFNKTEIFRRGDFLASGTLYRADIVKRFNGYITEPVNGGLENYEFVLRVISSGGRGQHIPFTLFNYRRHQSNISNIKREQIIANGQRMFSQLNYGMFSTNEHHPYGLKI